jgi:hypothetical protein
MHQWQEGGNTYLRICVSAYLGDNKIKKKSRKTKKESLHKAVISLENIQIRRYALEPTGTFFSDRPPLLVNCCIPPTAITVAVDRHRPCHRLCHCHCSTP